MQSLASQTSNLTISLLLTAAQLKKFPQLANLDNREWRLNNLYWIKDATGNRVKFRLNWAQQEIWKNIHTFNIVLKARQLGITTFFCLLLLDTVLWNRNQQCGIVAHTLNDTQSIFVDKLKFAFDNIHPAIRPLFKIVGDSHKELSFQHGSVIRVGTSLRSSTLNHLHISEFGKICSKYPEKAREIVTGALQTVHVGQNIYIESTAEGREGAFHAMWQRAWTHQGPFGPLDFKPFFLPWHKEPSYTLGISPSISNLHEARLKEYFAKLELEGIKLSTPQKWWYSKKFELLGDDILREFPSTPDEAFAASQEGYWFAEYIRELYNANRIRDLSYDRALAVHTAWDLGQSDSTSIWFFQINRSGDINFIDFWQKNNTPLDQINMMLNQKRYNYGTHIWPFDANARDRSGITFVQQARGMGLTGMVLEQHKFLDGINLVKTTLSRCWFDRVKCAEGLKYLENYKKKWNASFGGWTSEEIHDEASHCFVGDTQILMHYGMYRIMELPNKGEVWTQKGWKSYQNPRITRKDVVLVEVSFQDGTKVKCTPDHLFLTDKGWTFAKSLQRDLKIQSSWNHLLNIFQEKYTGFIRNLLTTKVRSGDFIGMFGWLLSVTSQRNATSIIEMETFTITDWRIWNAFLGVCIYLMSGNEEERQELNQRYQNLLVEELHNGRQLRKEEKFEDKLLLPPKVMKNGHGWTDIANIVIQFSQVLYEKGLGTRNIAALIAKPLLVESVKELKETQDVWCLTVPDEESFTLSNGAIVHNCAAAMRYACAGIDKLEGSGDKNVSKDMSILTKFWGG
jgi:hypothetical protein